MSADLLHPDCRASMFPPMDESSLAKLTADIKENGQREPITLFRGKVLDGWHRYQACCKLGIEPEIKIFDGNDEQALAYVLSANLNRRHMTPSQRAMVAARIAEMRQGARTDLQPSANLPKVSQTQAASMLEVSVRLVGDASEVIEKGEPDLVAKVESGAIAVSTAAATLRSLHSLPLKKKKISKSERERRLANENVIDLALEFLAYWRRRFQAEKEAKGGPLDEVSGKDRVLGQRGNTKLNDALVNAIRGDAILGLYELQAAYWHDQPTRDALETALRAIEKIPGVKQDLHARYGQRQAATNDDRPDAQANELARADPT